MNYSIYETPSSKFFSLITPIIPTREQQLKSSVRMLEFTIQEIRKKIHGETDGLLAADVGLRESGKLYSFPRKKEFGLNCKVL